VLRDAVRRGGPEPEVRFRLHVRNDNRGGTPPQVELRSLCGPDDDGAPCITVLMLGED
jgi:hypothetical protein